MSAFEEAFGRRLSSLRLGPGIGLVAVSGGPDSLALLHLLVRHPDAHALQLVVGHADHGIHPDSARVADEVVAAAAALGLPCEVGRLHLGAGTSEGAAREARYRWLFSTLERLGPGVVLTAHHRDDQVETVLMRFLSGSGPAGLAGMAAVRPRLVRPLLDCSRREIREYLASLRVRAWEDPANASPAHLRSWLRSSIIPLLRSQLPDLDRRLLAVSRQAGLDREAWDQLLDVLPLESRRERHGISVASGPLRAYDTRLGTALVIAVARRAGLALGDRRARRVLELSGAGRSGARLDLGGGWIAETAFGRVALVRWERRRVQAATIGGPGGACRIGGREVRWSRDPAPERLSRDAWVTWVIPGEYQLRAWAPGDRIRPLAGRGSRLVVRCMQDRKVPRHQRSRWPVLVQGDEIIWVPGVCRSDLRLPSPATEAVRIEADDE